MKNFTSGHEAVKANRADKIDQTDSSLSLNIKLIEDCAYMRKRK